MPEIFLAGTALGHMLRLMPKDAFAPRPNWARLGLRPVLGGMVCWFASPPEWLIAPALENRTPRIIRELGGRPQRRRHCGSRFSTRRAPRPQAFAFRQGRSR